MSAKTLVKRSELIPSVFNDFFKPWNEWFDNSQGDLWGNVLSVPAVNIVDAKDAYKVSLAIPGMKKDDFNINLQGNMLTISCEKEENKEEKDARYTRKEYNYTSFRRSFSLPEEVIKDKIEATYEDGVLHLTLPKNEEAKKAIASKHIAIK